MNHFPRARLLLIATLLSGGLLLGCEPEPPEVRQSRLDAQLDGYLVDLTSDWAWMRMWAAKRIGWMHFEAARAVPDLIDVLRNDPDPDVRGYAAEALGRIGRPAEPAIPVLETSLNDPDDFVVTQSALALRDIRLQLGRMAAPDATQPPPAPPGDVPLAPPVAVPPGSSEPGDTSPPPATLPPPAAEPIPDDASPPPTVPPPAPEDAAGELPGGG